MDLSKSYEFFNPALVKGRVHIIGCGSVGSSLAENIARMGVKKFDLWDFDLVEPHNIVNQQFTVKDIGRLKVEATRDIILSINEDADVKIHPAGWNGEPLSGFVFLAADSMDVRRAIVEGNMMNLAVKAMFDFRTGLKDAQHYAADWSDGEQRSALLQSMQFTDEEAKAGTPVSACGVTLGVVTTVRMIVGMGVNNFLNFLKGEGIWKVVSCNGFAGNILCI